MAANRRRFALDRVIAAAIVAGGAAVAWPVMAAPATDADTCINTSGDAAIAACTRAINSGKFKESDRAAHYAMRGFELSKKGQHDRAIADYEQAIRFDAGLVWAYAWRGDSYRAKSELDRAIADYDQAIRINPKLAVAYSKRGNAYRAKGALDRAIADYDQAIKLGPATAIAYNGRGDAYRAKGDNDRAIAEYDQAIRLDRKFALAYNGRASAYFQRGDGDRAIADFTQAISLAPDASFFLQRPCQCVSSAGRQRPRYRRLHAINLARAKLCICLRQSRHCLYKSRSV